MDEKLYLKNRLVVVSNRLPIVLTRSAEDEWQIQHGSGGLVTALAPVLKNRGGIWIGWPGNFEETSVNIENLLEKEEKNIGFKLKAVTLTSGEKENYYKGFSNEIIWPLFHDFLAHCNFDPKYWDSYLQVNGKFAQVILDDIVESDFIWVHDYHLMGLASKLKEKAIQNNIGFFLHIPFPPPDIFIRLPWRFQILHFLLEYDIIGFQTLRDRTNFLQCVRFLIGNIQTKGKGRVISLNIEGREVRVGAFPIGIDYNEFSNLAKSEAVSDAAWYLHENLPDLKIVFGIDRLDYSKGIPERLKAFRNALHRYPELRGKITLVQIVIPSRRGIKKYESLKLDIERLIGQINGEFSLSGWVPIHYMFRSLNKLDLLAHYRCAEIALITPLKDGMNLIAKEYCASNIEQNGVLILSEFAGVATQFQKNVLLVNPHDIEGMADALYQAFVMDEQTRISNMKKLRQKVRRYNIFWWVDSFLQAAISKNLVHFPVLEDYILTIEDELNTKLL
jgi:trehalose 6-phosphate synthase/phosphatase